MQSSFSIASALDKDDYGFGRSSHHRATDQRTSIFATPIPGPKVSLMDMSLSTIRSSISPIPGTNDAKKRKRNELAVVEAPTSKAEDIRELKQLRMKVKELTSSLEESQIERQLEKDELALQLKRKTHDISKLERQLHFIAAEESKLREQGLASKSSATDSKLSAQVAELQSEVESLSKRLSERDDEAANLRASLSEHRRWRDRASCLEAEKQALQTLYDEAKSRLAETELRASRASLDQAEAVQRQSTINELRARLERYEGAAEASSTVAGDEAQAVTRLEQLERELIRTRDQLRQKDLVIRQLEENAQKSREVHDQLLSTRDELRATRKRAERLQQSLQDAAKDSANTSAEKDTSVYAEVVKRIRAFAAEPTSIKSVQTTRALLDLHVKQHTELATSTAKARQAQEEAEQAEAERKTAESETASARQLLQAAKEQQRAAERKLEAAEEDKAALAKLVDFYLDQPASSDEAGTTADGDTSMAEGDETTKKGSGATLDAATLLARMREGLEAREPTILSSPRPGGADAEALKQQIGRMEDHIERLETEKASLVHQIGKGAYNPLTTKVLHLAKNPSVEAHQGALQKRISELMQQLAEAKAATSGDGVSTSTGAASSAAGDESYAVKYERLKTMFRDRMQLFREAVYLCTGYKVDMITASVTQGEKAQLRLRPMYASGDEFVVDIDMDVAAKKVTVKPECLDQLTRGSSKAPAYVTMVNSVPAFLGQLTLEMFDDQTMIDTLQ